MVELQDLAATITDYAGASLEEAADSFSLKPLLEGKTERHREYQRSALDADGRHVPAGWRTIAANRYKLIVTEGKEPELYDLLLDPWESENRAERDKDIVRGLKDVLGTKK